MPQKAECTDCEFRETIVGGLLHCSHPKQTHRNGAVIFYYAGIQSYMADHRACPIVSPVHHMTEDEKLSALHDLDLSYKYPLDIQMMNEGEDWELVAARAVLINLCDRKGIGSAFGSIDPAVRKEIVMSLARTIHMAKEVG